MLAGSSCLLLLFTGALQLPGEVTMATANGNGFLFIDTQYLSYVFPTQIKVEVNKRHHERTPNNVQDQCIDQNLPPDAHTDKDEDEK